MDQPMHDRQARLEILDGWTCSPGRRRHPWRYAWRRTCSRGDRPRSGGRLVYVLSDQTRASLGSSGATSGPGGPPKEWPGIDRIIYLNAGPAARDNTAIRNLSSASQIVGVGVPAKFNLRIVNHGPQPIEHILCDISLDGEVVDHKTVGPLEPRGEASEDFELVFNAEGPHRIVAQIKRGAAGDVLPADDVRYLGVQVVSGLSVLAVEGSDDSHKAARELFYYSVAVSTGTKPELAGIHVKTVSPLDLETEILGDYSVIVLGDVRTLPETSWRRIDHFVRAGGGLLLVLGERIQKDYYNDIAAKFPGLMPARLKEPKSSLPTAEPLRVRIDEPRHLALADLVGSDRGGLGVAQIRTFWRVGAAPDGPSLRAPIRLSNGDPLLIQSDVGQGRVLAWLTSANMAWNNLPAKPDYVPLMLNLSLYAAGCDRSAKDLLIGQSIVHSDGDSQTRQPGVVQRPDGATIKVDWSAAQDDMAIVYRQTDRPGLYVVTGGRKRSFDAVNVDPRESDLSLADEATVESRLGSATTIARDSNAEVVEIGGRPLRELAPLFTVLLLTLVAAETLLATLFGGRS
jgi:hypothetical protein